MGCLAGAIFDSHRRGETHIFGSAAKTDYGICEQLTFGNGIGVGRVFTHITPVFTIVGLCYNPALGSVGLIVLTGARSDRETQIAAQIGIVDFYLEVGIRRRILSPCLGSFAKIAIDKFAKVERRSIGRKVACVALDQSSVCGPLGNIVKKGKICLVEQCLGLFGAFALFDCSPIFVGNLNEIPCGNLRHISRPAHNATTDTFTSIVAQGMPIPSVHNIMDYISTLGIFLVVLDNLLYRSIKRGKYRIRIGIRLFSRSKICTGRITLD